MDVLKLAKYLNQISQCETHYDNMSPKIQQAYQKKAAWIIDFFIADGWTKLGGTKNTEQQVQSDSEIPTEDAKVNCDGCGKWYSDKEPCCPNCGSNSVYGQETTGEES